MSDQNLMENNQEKIIVSACLAGECCRYDGKSNADPQIKKWIAENRAVPICPERDGGMSTPRLPSEIKVVNGCRKVYNKGGEDVTSYFIHGAEKALETARRNGCTKAVLKAKSPSCGCGMIYDGSFSGTLIEGNGITTELFQKNGIEVITEKSVQRSEWQ